MGSVVRKASIAVLVVIVPLAIYHATSLLTSVMNVTRSPFGYTRHANVRYGDEPAHRLDIYLPNAAARAPVVIFWHGGMWKQGSKEDVRFVGAALARLGYVTVIPDYRLFPQVRFPAFVEDASRAVAWVRKEIPNWHGDPDSIFLMGHSAGAHIAAMVAFDDRYLRQFGESSNCIRGLIGMAGPYTLERPAMLLQSIFDKSAGNAWRPVDAVSAVGPPTLLLHGQADYVVWAGESTAMADRLARHAIPHELRIYPDRSHYDVLVAWWWPLRFRAPVRHDVRRFIEEVTAGRALRSACVPGG